MYIHLCSHPFWGLTSSGISGLWWVGSWAVVGYHNYGVIWTGDRSQRHHADGQHADGQHVDGQHADGQHADGQHAGGQHKGTPAEFRDQFSELQDLSNPVVASCLLAWGSARPGGCGSASDSQVLATGPREVLSSENLIP
jgi:hypothetical protein